MDSVEKTRLYRYCVIKFNHLLTQEAPKLGRSPHYISGPRNCILSVEVRGASGEMSESIFRAQSV